MSCWQKLGLSPSKSIQCRACGVRVSVRAMPFYVSLLVSNILFVVAVVTPLEIFGRMSFGEFLVAVPVSLACFFSLYGLLHCRLVPLVVRNG